jgi:catechol 2,3-dioxygenase-like lactoylglutathione lyase family enzyme
MLTVQRIDHLVLTCRNVKATIRFYTEVLGMREVTFGSGRKALAFGRQKLNLHPVGQTAGRATASTAPAATEPVAAVAAQPTPGSVDLCLIVTEPVDVVLAHLAASGIPIDEGPVMRTGALGPIESVYIRDPDGNLIELGRYVDDAD